MKSYKYLGNSSDQGHIPLSKMAVITIEQMLECLNEAGLTKCADLLKSECKSKKVFEKEKWRIFFDIYARVSLVLG